MGTIRTTLRVDADARAAARGLRPLDTALEDVKRSSSEAERSLKELGDRHRVRVDDAQLERARDQIGRLRREMRDRLEVDVNADTRDLQRKIGGLRRTIRELERDDVDVRVDVDTTDVLRARRALDGTLGTVRTGAARAGGIVTALGAAVGVATLGVGAVVGRIGVEVLSLADQLAQARIAFTQFLGTEPKADRFLDRLEDFAASTPFEFSELVESSQRLLAFGVEAGEVVGLMTSLGDAAALTGNNVDELATVWGQMQAKGRVANEELLQLTERGVPAYQLLADALGVTVAEVQAMATKGELLAGDVLPLLQERINATFGGGMAKQAETLGGLWSTLQDTAAGIGRELGTAFTPVVAGQIEDVTAKLEAFGDWATTHKQDIADVFVGIADSLLTSAAATAGAAEGIIRALGAVIGTLAEIQGKAEWHPLVKGLNELTGGADLGETADDLATVADGLGATSDGLADLRDKVRDVGPAWAAGFADADKLDAAKGNVADLTAELAELRKQPPTAELEVDIRDAEAKLAWWTAEAARLERDATTTTVEADIDKATTELADIDRALDNLHDKKPTPKVLADIKTWEDRRRVVVAQLEDLARRRTETAVVPKVDRFALASVSTVLDGLAAVRNVFFRPRTSTTTVRRPTEGGQPQAFGLMAMAADTLAAPARPFSTGAGGERYIADPYALPAGVARAGAAPARPVAPRRTEVAVYLDGAQIADRVASRVVARAGGSLATATNRKA